jgi:hypothetical protein
MLHRTNSSYLQIINTKNPTTGAPKKEIITITASGWTSNKLDNAPTKKKYRLKKALLCGSVVKRLVMK